MMNMKKRRSFNKNCLSESQFRVLFKSKIDPELLDLIPGIDLLLSDIPLDCIIHFLNRIVDKCWFNHLVLAQIALVWARNVHIYHLINGINNFLKWAIPNKYPDIEHFRPRDALRKAYSELTRARAANYDHIYGGIQVNVQNYLKTIPENNSQYLSKYILPKLNRDEQLRKFRLNNDKDAEADRKKAVFCLLPELKRIKNLAILRYLWIRKLDIMVSKVKKDLIDGNIILPVDIVITNFDDTDNLIFKIWNSNSWNRAHPENSEIRDSYILDNDQIFLEVVSDIPQNDWFLEGIKVGLIHNGKVKEQEILEYICQLNITPKLFWGIFKPGLISPDSDVQRYLSKIKRPWMNIRPENMKGVAFPPLFCVEPLLVASSIGILSMFIILSTGMRISELQQIRIDNKPIQSGKLGEIDGIQDSISDGILRHTIFLYPKDSQEMKSYNINDFVYSLLIDWCKVFYQSTHTEIGQVDTANLRNFGQSWKYTGKHKYIFQWNGCQLSDIDINACINFLIFNHKVLDTTGKQLRITSHLFRHCYATVAGLHGCTIDEMMKYLNHNSRRVTMYYSKPPDELVFSEIQPILNGLCDMVEEDSVSLRGYDDFVSFIYQSLRKFGCLQKINGGYCGTFRRCGVKFRCASCIMYVVDPNKENEIIELITCLEQSVKECVNDNQPLIADRIRQDICEWRLVLVQSQAMRALTSNLPEGKLPNELVEVSANTEPLLNVFLHSLLVKTIDKP
jgi:hypothetical protein